MTLNKQIEIHPSNHTNPIALYGVNNNVWAVVHNGECVCSASSVPVMRSPPCAIT